VDALIRKGRTEDDVVAMKLLADNRSPTSPGPDNRDEFIRTALPGTDDRPGTLTTTSRSRIAGLGGSHARLELGIDSRREVIGRENG
jgi:hypothetical protein